MKKILVKGPALSQSGYGEHARFVLRALRNYPDLFDIYFININWGNTSWLWKDDEERRWIDGLLAKTIQFGQSGGTCDISAQVTIPNEWENLAPVNIGITAGIESTKMSTQFLEGCLRVNKIITISNHAKEPLEKTEYEATNKQTGQKFMAKTVCPIEVIGYPVKDIKPCEQIDLDLKYDFNFLAIGTLIPRKNLSNTIKWFVEQFYDDEIGLVVKTSTARHSLRDRQITEQRLKEVLKEYEGRTCQVYLLHGDMSEEEMTSLYQHSKIKSLVSLSHGEGFGLPMFEAAYNALPVVSPAWGGQCDFLYMPVKDKKGKVKNKPMFSTVSYDIKPVQPEAVWEGVIQKDSMWCFPKEWDFKKTIKGVVKNYGSLKSQAKKLQKYLQKEFCVDNQYKKMAENISGEPITVLDIKELPKISIITSVYDGDEFIEPFLEDITNQTIFKEKCELILVNANSPGNEEAVIKKYMKKYPDNIVYKKLEEDPGIYGTWNIALELSSGEYITNANLDDRRVTNSLERHAKELYYNPDVSLVYGDCLVTHSPNETFEKNTSGGEVYIMEEFSKEAMLRGNQPHNNPMWRRDLHKKHGFFNQKYKSAGDWEFFLRCAFAEEKFKKIGEQLSLYYFNPTGVSTNPQHLEWKQEEEMSIYKKYQKLYLEQ